MIVGENASPQLGRGRGLFQAADVKTLEKNVAAVAVLIPI